MLIKVKAKPNSKKQSVETDGEYVVVSVKEAPEDNKANIAVIKTLAKYYNVEQKSIKIKSGLRNKIKLIEIAVN
ncbi:MAG TPA: DUF167 domain-containing protein [Candidatus Paceibacterota bacterium]|nr:DUF167 domain-containing protein [Candidatus Paceibacterota bacterium]